MKKGTLISIIIALIAVAGALLGLVAYMRSRRCLECGDVEEDYVPDASGDYDMEYYVDDLADNEDVLEPAAEALEEEPTEDDEEVNA